MTDLIRFDNVVRVFGDSGAQKVALDGITLAIRPGEIVSIVGRSGSGKSTLLHLAAGIDIPTAGDVYLLGEKLSALGDKRRTLMRRDQVGLVFQFFHLLPRLSVRENIALPEMIAGRKRKDYHDRITELLEFVDLADRASEPVGVLSGGEMQRIAVCRALIRKPSILLADEPTGNLDDQTADSIMQLLMDLVSEENNALLFVTHDARLAALADRTYQLHDGKLET